MQLASVISEPRTSGRTLTQNVNLRHWNTTGKDNAPLEFNHLLYDDLIIEPDPPLPKSVSFQDSIDIIHPDLLTKYPPIPEDEDIDSYATFYAPILNLIRAKVFQQPDFPILADILMHKVDDTEWTKHKALKPTPINSKVALTNRDKDQWSEAMIKESQKIIKRSTWRNEYTLKQQKQRYAKAMKSMFIFKVKHELELYRFKARLTAKGFSQIKGFNNNNTYAPTAKFESILIVLCLSTIHNWNLTGIDIENAFPECDLDEDIDMVLPEDAFRNLDGSPIVVKLLKSLYGLKQASNIFYSLLSELLDKLGATPTIHDPCVFVHYNEATNKLMIVIIWVDDIVFTGDDTDLIESTITSLRDAFDKITSYDGDIKRYVGMNICRDRVQRVMTLSQDEYIKHLADKYLPNDARTKPIPVNPTHDLRTPAEHDIDNLYEQVGELGYLADRTKPQIKFPVGLLRSAAPNPTKVHESAVRHIHRYLNQDIHVRNGISFRKGDSEEFELFGLVDGSGIRSHDSRSQLAYCFFLNLFSGTICCRSTKSNRIATAPSETELHGIVLAIKKAIYLRGFLAAIGFPQKEPTKLYTDSLTILEAVLFDKPVSKKSEHVILALNFVKEHIAIGTITLLHVDTGLNTADVLTKNLAVKDFQPKAQNLTDGHNGVAPSSSAKRTSSLANPYTRMNTLLRKKKRKHADPSKRFHDIDEEDYKV